MNRASSWLPWCCELGLPKGRLPFCTIAKDAGIKSPSSRASRSAPNDSIGQEEVVLFLQELLRHLRGPVIVLLDNSSTHAGPPLAQLLRRHPRLHIEHFPSYSPDLNPDEGVWSLAKRDLANGCPLNVNQLMRSVIASVNKVRRSPKRLRGCILESDLPHFLF